MKTFPLQILRINKTVYDGEAVSVNAPGTAGEVTVLADHETMLTSLKPGKLYVRTASGDEEPIEIENGFMEATREKVIILL